MLLGVGGYGRVFKGRFHGREVAIKVINCYPEELPRVLREAEIMLEADHPNVVRALSCVVKHNPAVAAAAAGGGAGIGITTLNDVQLLVQQQVRVDVENEARSNVSLLASLKPCTCWYGSGHYPGW